MIRMVPTDDSFAVRGAALQKMVDEDKAAGLIPFYVSELSERRQRESERASRARDDLQADAKANDAICS